VIGDVEGSGLLAFLVTGPHGFVSGFKVKGKALKLEDGISRKMVAKLENEGEQGGRV